MKATEMPSTSISTRREAGVEFGWPHGKQPHFGDILPGRPRPAANLPVPTTDKEIDELYEEYHGILPKLRYGEAMSLCRALRCSYSTYLMRRYKHRKAKLPEVMLVVDWYRNGKPMTVTKRKLTSALLFFDGG